MIIPPDQPHDRTITISQTSHSWISGQLARAWGNRSFAGFQPFEPICYAAEQHDIGFLSWENHSTLNLETGLPFTFEELPESPHLDIWRTGIYQLKPICSYASLIVSLHFSSLCERFHRRQKSADSSEAAEFLREQKEFQVKTREELSYDPLFKEAVFPEALTYHRDLIATWDIFSLELCRGRSNQFTFPDVPIGLGKHIDLRLSRHAETGDLWEVDPWPFSVESLQTWCEGRVLVQKFSDQEEMREALRQARRTSIQFRLIPAGSRANATIGLTNP
jgi:hypothetical protein